MKGKKTGSYMVAISSILTIIIVLVWMLYNKYLDIIIYSIIEIINCIIILIFSAMFIRERIDKNFIKLYQNTIILLSATISIVEILKFQSSSECCSVFFSPITILMMIIGSCIICLSKEEHKNETKTTN